MESQEALVFAFIHQGKRYELQNVNATSRLSSLLMRKWYYKRLNNVAVEPNVDPKTVETVIGFLNGQLLDISKAKEAIEMGVWLGCERVIEEVIKCGRNGSMKDLLGIFEELAKRGYSTEGVEAAIRAKLERGEGVEEAAGGLSLEGLVRVSRGLASGILVRLAKSGRGPEWGLLLEGVRVEDLEEEDVAGLERVIGGAELQREFASMMQRARETEARLNEERQREKEMQQRQIDNREAELAKQNAALQQKAEEAARLKAERDQLKQANEKCEQQKQQLQKEKDEATRAKEEAEREKDKLENIAAQRKAEKEKMEKEKDAEIGELQAKMAAYAEAVHEKMYEIPYNPDTPHDGIMKAISEEIGGNAIERGAVTVTAQKENKLDKAKQLLEWGSNTTDIGSYSKSKDEWVQFTFDRRIRIDSYSVGFNHTRWSGKWKSWSLEGSNDDSQWTSINEVTNDQTFLSQDEGHWSFALSPPYKMVRIVMHEIHDGEFWVCMRNIEFFGEI